VAVIGAGTMGRGIAQAFATAGWQVGLSDALPDALPSARAAIDATLQSAVSRQKLAPGARSEILGRIQCCASLSEACQGAEVVVEAVVEDLATKCGVLREAAGPAVPQALLATNTSSLSVTEIAKSQPRPDRVIGLHFFNPVHVMRLVEVVVPDHCPEQTRSQALDLVRALGKEAIVVKDSPGFASSRLGVVLGLEAMRMLEQGIASAADIDRAMELGYNHPMGPLRLTDLVGLDVRLRIAEHLYRSLGGSQFEPPSILRRLVAEGRLGRKTGGGFYDYPNHE
jgi:3-hydroxybutyryl-CoA dehydrogenase